MDDSSSVHTDSELNTENQLSTDSEPIKKPPTRKIARKRPTHVRLQNHNLRAIPNLESRKDSFVLYLYNNKIENVTNLDVFTKLTHLYLSHNNIRRLENMDKLANLEKLYIGHNKISVLEGLGNLRRLRELHMESQRLPEGDALTFDPRSIQAVRGTLHVLNINNNDVTSLKPLTPLSYLTDLCCADNQLSSFVDLSESLRELPCLTRLDLKGNPICDLQRHRDAVVESAPELRKLDDIDVTSALRQFISGRSQAVARRQSAVKQRLVAVSASDDFLLRDVCGEEGLRHPQVALSQGSLPQPRRTSVTSQPRQTSSTHLRVGNMLTLTRQQRALVRTAAQRCAPSDANLETSGGDLGRLETSGCGPWKLETPSGDLRRSRKQETLPSSPARRPVGSDARSARPSVSQCYTPAESSTGDLRQLAAWPTGEEARSGGVEKTPLRQTMSEEMPNRMNMLAIMQ